MGQFISHNQLHRALIGKRENKNHKSITWQFGIILCDRWGSVKSMAKMLFIFVILTQSNRVEKNTDFRARGNQV